MCSATTSSSVAGPAGSGILKHAVGLPYGDECNKPKCPYVRNVSWIAPNCWRSCAWRPQRIVVWRSCAMRCLDSAVGRTLCNVLQLLPPLVHCGRPTISSLSVSEGASVICTTCRRFALCVIWRSHPWSRVRAQSRDGVGGGNRVRQARCDFVHSYDSSEWY